MNGEELQVGGGVLQFMEDYLRRKEDRRTSQRIRELWASQGILHDLGILAVPRWNWRGEICEWLLQPLADSGEDLGQRFCYLYRHISPCSNRQRITVCQSTRTMLLFKARCLMSLIGRPLGAVVNFFCKKRPQWQ